MPALETRPVDQIGGGRGRLGSPTRRPIADAQQLAVDPDLDPERALVIGSTRLGQPVRRPLAGTALGELLEPALGALEGADRRLGGKLWVGPPWETPPAGLPPGFGSPSDGRRRSPSRRWFIPSSARLRHNRLNSQIRSASATTAAALRLALTQEQRLAEIEPAGQPGEPGGRYDRRSAGAQVALVLLGMSGVERLGDGKVDHRISQELEALVVTGRLVTVLVMPAGVDEGLLEQVEVTDGQAAPPGLRRDARWRGSGRRPRVG